MQLRQNLVKKNLYRALIGAALAATSAWAGIPNPPAELRVTSMTPQYIRLAWTDRSTNEEWFLLKEQGRKSSVLKARANETQAQFDNPPCGQRMKLFLTAGNHEGRSDGSNVVTVETQPCGGGPKADLTIEGLNLSPNPVGTGMEFTTRFTVANHGAVRSKESRARWEMAGPSSETMVCPVPALDAGQSYSCEINVLAAPLEPMAYGVWVYADVENAVEEGAQGEANNEATLPLKVVHR